MRQTKGHEERVPENENSLLERLGRGREDAACL